jgi:hypothetical protein
MQIATEDRALQTPFLRRFSSPLSDRLTTNATCLIVPLRSREAFFEEQYAEQDEGRRQRSVDISYARNASKRSHTNLAIL